MKCKLLFIGSLIMLASCTKTAVQEEPILENSVNRLDYLKSTSNFSSRTQVYNLLTQEERFRLWNDHFVMAKAQFNRDGNTRKLELVQELQKNLSASVFTKGTTEYNVFLNYFIPVWSEKAKKVFTDQELYDLTFNPTSSTIGSLVAPPDTGGGPVADCFCNVGTSGFSCRKITVGIPSGITITNGICELARDCNRSSLGCGWLLLSSCNGDHCNF